MISMIVEIFIALFVVLCCLQSGEAILDLNSTWEVRTGSPAQNPVFIHRSVDYDCNMLPVGGTGPSSPVNLTVTEYDPVTDIWTDLVVDSNCFTPDNRQQHSAVIMQEQLLVFSGLGSFGLTDQLIALNLSADPPCWRVINNTVKPAARGFHTAVVFNDTEMIVFGGRAGSTTFGDTWRFTFADGWSLIDASGPISVSEHTSVVHEGCMYVYGGRNSTNAAQAELWKLTFATVSWTQLTSGILRQGHEAVVLHDHFMLAVGGSGSSGIPSFYDINNDTWIDMDNLLPFTVAQMSMVDVCGEVIVYAGIDLSTGALHNELQILQKPPTPSPTPFPTPSPTANPTPSPTPFPTAFPTPSPTATPTANPTSVPTPHGCEGPPQIPNSKNTENCAMTPLNEFCTDWTCLFDLKPIGEALCTSYGIWDTSRAFCGCKHGPSILFAEDTSKCEDLQVGEVCYYWDCTGDLTSQGTAICSYDGSWDVSGAFCGCTSPTGIPYSIDTFPCFGTATDEVCDDWICEYGKFPFGEARCERDGSWETSTALCATCIVSEWSYWSECSADCEGTESRYRSVVSHAPGHLELCPTLLEERPCNDTPCKNSSASSKEEEQVLIAVVVVLVVGVVITAVLGVMLFIKRRRARISNPDH